MFTAPSCLLPTPLLPTAHSSTQNNSSSAIIFKKKKKGIFRSENLSIWVDTSVSYNVLDLFNSTWAKLSKSCAQSGLLEIVLHAVMPSKVLKQSYCSELRENTKGKRPMLKL